MTILKSFGKRAFSDRLLAYDLTFSVGPGGEHSTTINGEGVRPTREQCVQLAGQHDISNKRAQNIFCEVEKAVLRWPEFGELSGVSGKTLQQLLHVHETYSVS